MGFQGAREFLEQGRDVEGGIMLAQGIHGLGELNRAVSSLLEGSAHRALTSIATRMEGKAAQSLLGQMSKLGKVTEAPMLSTAFAVFNIYEDMDRKSPLGYTDVTLDSAILLTGLARLEMAPVTLALTNIRLGLDPLYSEIKGSLDSLPAGTLTGQHCLAVLKGITLAFQDIAQGILSVVAEFSLWSLIYKIPELDKQHRKDVKFIEELKSAESYDGRDTYVIEADKACDTINNWLSDAESDTVHLPSNHQNLRATLRDNGDLEIHDTVSKPGTCVILQNWRGGWAWQHIVFISSDFVMFQVSNATSTPEIQPMLIDFSSRGSRMEFDLATFPGNQQMTVVGSPHDDQLYGNERNNVLSGMGGAEFLKGRGGSDTYIIDCQQTQLRPIIIDNKGTKEVMDFLLLPGDFEGLEFVSSSTDAHLRYQKQPGCN
eukprot:g21716.t1